MMIKAITMFTAMIPSLTASNPQRMALLNEVLD
jgi:hypothetical protein